MPVLDTPITTDDRSLKKVLGMKEPALLVLYDGRQKDTPLEDALQREARKRAGDLLVVRVDISQNPETHAQYNHPQTPALVTLTKAMFGRKVKSKAERIRPADVRAHIDYLLNDTPLPEAKPQTSAQPQSAGKKAGHVTDATFRQEVLKSKVPVLVDFWAAWCGPCQVIAPYVDQVAKDYAGKIKVVKLNVDESKLTANQYNVRSIPTFIMFDGGQPVERFSGASPQAIRQMVEETLLPG